MNDARTDPPFIADERTMLNNWLDWHRQTLAVKCQGLSAPQLRERSAPPSPMSLLGLVRHMAHVEHMWFRVVLNGEECRSPVKTPDNPDGDFLDVDAASPEEAFALWRAEIGHAREVSEGLPLDAVGKAQRHGEDCSYRWILVHMIEEYARHNGHADLIRERIDGATGE
ncbi:putative damage-inducible protein DinB [Nocardiopsis terrae]|uniref:Damage-inducible protein DinB n=1 Tax=Nocardiopsis terrae TaxID=372655 RepID=A0ABR9HH42_9ACTN|nr:DinB family protein [Nocardiopsis terrae]MBE1458346.1 putative damage-inducible protein DinB [Nocardiopsis terrae]